MRAAPKRGLARATALLVFGSGRTISSTVYGTLVVIQMIWDTIREYHVSVEGVRHLQVVFIEMTDVFLLGTVLLTAMLVVHSWRWILFAVVLVAIALPVGTSPPPARPRAASGPVSRGSIHAAYTPPQPTPVTSGTISHSKAARGVARQRARQLAGSIR